MVDADLALLKRRQPGLDGLSLSAGYAAGAAAITAYSPSRIRSASQSPVAVRCEHVAPRVSDRFAEREQRLREERMLVGGVDPEGLEGAGGVGVDRLGDQQATRAAVG